MLFCQFYGHVIIVVVCWFFFWILGVVSEMVQDFQNELIRKLNIYDLSKWKINYPSDHIHFALATAQKKLVDQAKFTIGIGFH